MKNELPAKILTRREPHRRQGSRWRSERRVPCTDMAVCIMGINHLCLSVPVCKDQSFKSVLTFPDARNDQGGFIIVFSLSENIDLFNPRNQSLIFSHRHQVSLDSSAINLWLRQMAQTGLPMSSENYMLCLEI